MRADDIIWRLAQLASLPFQERYVIGGTSDEYVLATELLENVDGLKFLVRRVDKTLAFSNEQMAALEDLFSYIEKHSGEALVEIGREQSAQLIRESSVWKTLRAKAGAALSGFGKNAAEMTVEDINMVSE